MDSCRAAPAELAADPAPMPLILMIAAGADHVQEDAPETGVSELCLHNRANRLEQLVVSDCSVHNQGTFCLRNLAGKRRDFPLGQEPPKQTGGAPFKGAPPW